MKKIVLVCLLLVALLLGACAEVDDVAPASETLDNYLISGFVLSPMFDTTNEGDVVIELEPALLSENIKDFMHSSEAVRIIMEPTVSNFLLEAGEFITVECDRADLDMLIFSECRIQDN